MKTDTLTLSPESAAEYLKDCKPGETKTLEVTIEVTANDEDGLAANISNVSYAEPAEPDAEAEPEPDAPPMPMMDKPMKARRPAAVMAILGKPSKK